MSSALLGPAQPVYILRGHDTQIHAVHFYLDNLRLLTGDADGWVVIWDLTVRRPVAVWRAHEKSILTLRSWQADKIITHGRDDALRVWHVPSSAEASLSKALPAEGVDINRQSPWLLHSFPVNTMNFCAFAVCQDLGGQNADDSTLTLAVPGTKDGFVHIHELPSEKCLHVVAPSSAITKSLVMAIRLYCVDGSLFLVTGNEAGETSVQAYHNDGHHAEHSSGWHTLYTARPHSQPILSLDIAPLQSRYFTSSADAIIASHPLPKATTDSPSFSTEKDIQIHKTGHAGQQSLVVRQNDNRVLATAGWDARVRVYSAKTLKEVAVLKWHKEGCYAVALGTVKLAERTACISNNAPKQKTTKTQVGKARNSEDHVIQDESAVVTRQKTADNDVMVATTAHSELPPWQEERRMTVRTRREQATRDTHWLAAGAKDGKISLWDIF